MAEPAKARGVRERVRAQMTAEILAEARAQLSSAGADGLSLRAISRDLGMASSAIYRYFPSRDALLTQLIIDAFNAVGEAAEIAESFVPRTDLAGRFLATATAVRAWALANQHEYALIFGSPVPGYAAPQDTIAPATRIPVVLIGILMEAAANDRIRSLPPLPDGVAETMQPLLQSIAEIVGSQPESNASTPDGQDNQLSQGPRAPGIRGASRERTSGTGANDTPADQAHDDNENAWNSTTGAGATDTPAEQAPDGNESARKSTTGAGATGTPAELADGNDGVEVTQSDNGVETNRADDGAELPVELIARGLIAWTHLIGAINFELFGHRHNVIGSSEAAKRTFFDYEMSTMINLSGIE